MFAHGPCLPAWTWSKVLILIAGLPHHKHKYNRGRRRLLLSLFFLSTWRNTHTENWHLFKFLAVFQNSLVSDFKWLQGDPVLARNLQKLLQWSKVKLSGLYGGWARVVLSTHGAQALADSTQVGAENWGPGQGLLCPWAQSGLSWPCMCGDIGEISCVGDTDLKVRNKTQEPEKLTVAKNEKLYDSQYWAFYPKCSSSQPHFTIN